MNFDKIKAPTVRESFVRELENKILSGELKPGDKLPPAKELCELMGVSLTVVNAGMSELANNGFVETVPRRGTYIADYKKKAMPAHYRPSCAITAESCRARTSAPCARPVWRWTAWSPSW